MQQSTVEERRRRRSVRWLGWTLALAVCFGARPASAEAGETRGFAYSAPDFCPQRAQFSDQVALRTAAWRPAGSEFQVSVEIAPDATGLVARVRFARAGRETLRELRAESCEELVRALALIVSILIDPHANVTPAPARSGAPPASSSGPAAPEAEAAQGPRLFFVAGPELAVQTAAVPRFAVGTRVFIAFGRDGERWASSLRLGLTRIRNDAQSEESGALATLEVDSARLEGGVFRFAWGRLELEPGVLVELGRLRAEGQHPLGPALREKVWATVGLNVRPSVTLAGRLVLGAAAGVHLPLMRYRFAFIGENTLYQNEAFGFDGALMLGVRFP
jgi:hypothetical protein